MSVRGLWIIKPSPNDGGKVLYSRRFPTVEQRFKRSMASNKGYHPIPLDTELCNEIMTHCYDGAIINEFNEERDSVSFNFDWPVFDLFGGNLWPVICLHKNDLLFVSVVSFNPTNDQRPPLIKISGIPAAVSILEGMMEVLFSQSPTTKTELTQTSPLLVELYHYVCLAAPFGTPIDTNPSNLKLQLQFKKAVSMPKDKVPSWRPAVYKGTSKLFLRIKEEIRAMQYDKSDYTDVWQVYGSVICKAEIEGHPDILVSLTTPANSTHLDHLVVHSCVQNADTDPVMVTSPIGGGDNESGNIRNIRFSPPLEDFTLCHYQLTPSLLPIRGYYQMKGEKAVELLVQLKLHETVRNNFDYCEVQIPFYNRGPISKIDNVVPATATYHISSNGRCLVWNIGQRFPSKTLEVSFGATVTFVEFSPADPDITIDKMADSQFCIEQNAYCEVNDISSVSYSMS
jgi:AP-5 complex subunit mu-1